MKNKFYRTLLFQVLIIIIIVLVSMSLIQYRYTEEVIEGGILEETKKQALTFLLGIERQIQTLQSPYDRKEVVAIFREANRHDISSLGFSIINIYSYDTAGKVFAYLHEPEELTKDLYDKYGAVMQDNSPYLGEEIEVHHVDETGTSTLSVDVIIPIHYGNQIIGGLEVEIDLNKTFVIIKEIDDRYEKSLILILASTLLILFFLLFATIYWKLLAPVKQLGKVTGQIAGGDLKARTSYKSQDEIGELGESINVMAQNIEDLFIELDNTYIATLNSLAKALEARDEYTAHHSENVTNYSLKLGYRIGLGEEEIKALGQGAMLHDLGKIGVPDAILKKPDRLLDDEFKKIKEHAQLTAEILRPLEKFKHFSDIARSHHERWDGKGYPDGLSGEDIPLLARIVAIADTWDAMVSNRVYRKGMGKEKALSIFEKEWDMGQWDPYLVREFISLIKEEPAFT